MATRSHIYVETNDGYLGVYCHYDGYPETMVPTLNTFSYKELYSYILRGMIGGGFDAMRPGDTPEYLAAQEPCILRDPSCREESTYVCYVYVMSADGSIAYRSANESEWLSSIEHLYEDESD
jgi:hypothetical protein